VAVVRGYLVGRARTPVGAVHGLARITSCFPLTTGGAGDLLALQPTVSDNARDVVVVAFDARKRRPRRGDAEEVAEKRARRGTTRWGRTTLVNRRGNSTASERGSTRVSVCAGAREGRGLVERRLLQEKRQKIKK
jgi:hypothetical protein